VRINPWLKKSEKNLTALSISGDFSEALKEWKFSGDVIDHGDASVDCEMCGHPELRYHFEIKNKLKSTSLWVGSSCIARFQEIELLDEEGNWLISENSRTSELKRQLKLKLSNLVLEPLRILWKSYPDESKARSNIEKIVKKFNSQGTFSPQELILLFNGLDQNSIPYERQRFKVNLRTKENRAYVFKLSQNELFKLQPCFTNEQLNKNPKIMAMFKT
jgi:hypothetical protein